MPRKTRTPLGSHDSNVATATAGQGPAAANLPLKAKEEPSLASAVADSQTEVERLQAKVDELTALLGASSLNEDKPDIKPVIAIDEKPLIGSLVQSVAVGPPPKRPPTLFHLFCAERRADVAAANPELGFAEVNAKLGELWKGVDAAGREKYEIEVAADRERYGNEKAAYEKKKEIAFEQQEALKWKQEQDMQARAVEHYQKHLAEEADKKKREAEKQAAKEDKKPKKCLTAFQAYMKFRHAEFERKAKEGEKKPENFMSAIAEDWAKMNKSKAAKWRGVKKEVDAAVVADQARYERELKEYEADLKARRAAEEAQNEKVAAEALGAYRKHKKEQEEIVVLKKDYAEKAKIEKQEKAAARAAKKAVKAEKEKGPKRPANAYSWYVKEMFKDEEVKKKSEENNIKIMSLVAEMWKTTPEEEKVKYQELAAKDKERYEKDVVEYKKNPSAFTNASN